MSEFNKSTNVYLDLNKEDVNFAIQKRKRGVPS